MTHNIIFWISLLFSGIMGGILTTYTYVRILNIMDRKLNKW